jgi:hypothetical protein
MTGPRNNFDQDDDSDLPEDLLENIEDTPTEDEDFGDETQSDEEYAAEEGLELDDLVRDSRDDDE